MELPLIKHLAKKYRRTTIKLERSISYSDENSNDDSSSSEESSPVLHRRKHKTHRNKSRSPMRNKSRSPKRNKSRSPTKRRIVSDESKSGSPVSRTVKTICKPLKVSPVFTCSDGRVKIRLNITGGITPYKYKWSDGSTQSFLDGLPFGDKLSVTITDARKCDTIVDFVTPDLSLCK